MTEHAVFQNFLMLLMWKLYISLTAAGNDDIFGAFTGIRRGKCDTPDHGGCYEWNQPSSHRLSSWA